MGCGGAGQAAGGGVENRRARGRPGPSLLPLLHLPVIVVGDPLGVGLAVPELRTGVRAVDNLFTNHKLYYQDVHAWCLCTHALHLLTAHWTSRAGWRLLPGRAWFGDPNLGGRWAWQLLLGVASCQPPGHLYWDYYRRVENILSMRRGNEYCACSGFERATSFLATSQTSACSSRAWQHTNIYTLAYALPQQRHSNMA